MEYLNSILVYNISDKDWEKIEELVYKYIGSINESNSKIRGSKSYFLKDKKNVSWIYYLGDNKINIKCSYETVSPFDTYHYGSEDIELSIEGIQLDFIDKIKNDKIKEESEEENKKSTCRSVFEMLHFQNIYDDYICRNKSHKD